MGPYGSDQSDGAGQSDYNNSANYDENSSLSVEGRSGGVSASGQGKTGKKNDGDQKVKYLKLLNVKSGVTTSLILGNADDDAQETYSPYGGDGSDVDKYRKNGDPYNYLGGQVQNWSNIKNEDDRFAVFTDTQTGDQTKFPGASITDFMVLELAGYTTANGSIHADKSFGLADLEHEYGHYIQALLYGTKFYNTVIIPASLYSAMTSTNDEHNHFWTEVDANKYAVHFFGKNSAIANDDQNFPKK